MKKILYIGNNLNSKTTNLSGIQTLGPLLENEGFTMYYASSKFNKILRLIDMFWSCLKLSKKVDLILIDTYSTQNFYYALGVSQLCRLFGLDYIPILHGGKLPFRLKNNPKLCQLIFNNAKFNVSPSMYLKRSFENEGFQNIEHIPNAIGIDNYNLKAKTFDVPKLLWVRSFSEIYNPQLAVQVLFELKKKYPKSSLCMVGPDADGSRKKVENLAKELNLNVNFTGKLEKKAWIKLSQDYNVFINTTNFDNTPLSVIEAMALGLPVVSTNVGGMPFLIDNNVNGLLVKPDNVEEMSSAVVSIFDSLDKRNQLIINARKKAESFNWQNIKSLWFSALSSNKHENIS